MRRAKTDVFEEKTARKKKSCSSLHKILVSISNATPQQRLVDLLMTMVAPGDPHGSAALAPSPAVPLFVSRRQAKVACQAGMVLVDGVQWRSPVVSLQQGQWAWWRQL